MDAILSFFELFLKGLQTPTLGFLLGGMLMAAMGSRLTIPDQVYKFIVFVLLMKIGLRGGMEIRNANLEELLLPALFAVLTGVIIVYLGKILLAKLPGINVVDAIATAGLFGAVSASTFAAGMLHLDDIGMEYEAWVSALYPFMDIPALVLAIVLGRLAIEKSGSKEEGASLKKKRKPVSINEIVKESLQGSALSALILGLILGLFTQPEPVYESFYLPLFRGFLSILMIIMGIEAWQRLSELRRVAHWYAVYAVIAPLLHGGIAFGLGAIAHHMTGFSPGGVVLLAILASSSSDISGPPTLRAGIPSANPSAYIGSSTSIGTPICIAIGIPLFTELATIVF
ncbi:sodium-dependent bicarbonate transport family permease [Aliikangiella marina]|uniref:Sodium-dependent bicarbonate transport family permease n=1 Tax=Aliikangiella marina TaxID=1712262 RepID=A0A545TIS1_9GAMM|nr:sodium-dependent bicarbonate transport family permease [Aliikangiella marina]TQV77108.1 sodium-dependent bicarbonate transport family permease [Aliikangiella marina]